MLRLRSLLLVVVAASSRREARIDTRRNRAEYQSNPIERGYPYYVEPQYFNGNRPLPMYLFPWQAAELPKFKEDHPEGHWNAPRLIDGLPASAYGKEAWEKAGGNII